MKRIMLSLIALLLIGSTVFLTACFKKPTEKPNPGDDPDTPPDTPPVDTPPDDDPTDGVIDVYDPSNPLTNPASTIANYLYSDGGLLVQPEKNIYELTAYMRPDIVGQFENAQDVIDRGRPETPLYGIYTYTHEYYDNQDSVTNVAGFTCARMGSDRAWSDEYMLSLCEADIEVMRTLGVGVRNATAAKSFYLPQKYGDSNPDENAKLENIENYDLAGWINEYIRVYDEFIAEWGPNGAFFNRHPNANYNPIRYYEIFNEPNFQYLIPVKTESGADDAFAPIKYQVYAIMQTCVYKILKEKYGNEIQIIGVSAGGGAQESGRSYVSVLFSYKDNPTVNGYLNNALNPDAIVKHANESDEAFEARKESVRSLRTLLGLAEGEQMQIDILNTMDIISTHPYIDDNSPFAAFKTDNVSQGFYIQELRKTMVASAGDNEEDLERAKTMPIWFTECGWQLKGPKAYAEAYPEDVANGIYGGQAAEYNSKQTGTSQINQAAMEVQDFLWGIRNGIEFISYMHMYDTDGCNYGLVNYGYNSLGGRSQNDKSPRLTLYAIGTMTDILPNPALKNVVQEGLMPGTTDEYLFVYEIEADVGGEIVTTVFSPLQATAAEIAWESQYALVTDMFGKSQIVKAVNGTVSVDAGPYMTYVREVPLDMLIAHGLVPSYTVQVFDFLGQAWTTKEDII